MKNNEQHCSSCHNEIDEGFVDYDAFYIEENGLVKEYCCCLIAQIKEKELALKKFLDAVKSKWFN